MNENTTPQGGGTVAAPIAENEYVKELFTLMQDNGKETSGLSALLNYVNGMEDFLIQAEDRITEMKSQLDTMKEVQNHPVKTALQNAVKALESKVAEIREQLSELKSNIIEGCKNAVTVFKEKGAAVLDKLASFLHIKSGLQTIKNNTVKGVDNCDKVVARIETFSSEYHKAGRALKNMARVITGKKAIDATKEAGKLSQAVSAPYRAEKACLLGIRKAVNNMIASLENLEQSAESKRGERADKPKKPTLKERLNAKKEIIRQRDLEKTTPERGVIKPGIEV